MVTLVGASVLLAAGALTTPARNGYAAQGVNLYTRFRTDPTVQFTTGLTAIPPIASLSLV